MKLTYEILPGEGMDDIRFGAEPGEVAETMGQPADKDVDDEDDMHSEMWMYEEEGLTFFFEGDDLQLLCCIESSHPETLLFGTKIFDLNENTIIDLMKSKGYEEIDLEEEAWGEKRISFDDLMMDFYFENSQLITVNWSVIDEDE